MNQVNKRKSKMSSPCYNARVKYIDEERIQCCKCGAIIDIYEALKRGESRR